MWRHEQCSELRLLLVLGFLLLCFAFPSSLKPLPDCGGAVRRAAGNNIYIYMYTCGYTFIYIYICVSIRICMYSYSSHNVHMRHMYIYN